VIEGTVLDVSAITDIAGGRTAYGAAFLDTAVAAGRAVVVPAAAWLEAWGSAPASSRPFLEMLSGLPVILFSELDAPAAQAAGLMVGQAGDPQLSAGTAHAVQLARSIGWPVLTADRESVIALDPSVPFESLP
jgi:hypothetical protein